MIGSRTEEFFKDTFAPQLMKTKTRNTILFVYLVWTIICIYGCYNLKSWFSIDMQFNEYFTTYDYYRIKDEYYNEDFETMIFVDGNGTKHFFSERA